MIFRTGWRGALSRALLLLLAWADLPAAAVREVPARLSQAVSPKDRGFWPDPGYAAFVDAVRAATPETATIALIAPRTTDVYVYRAVYGLVPRRVVGPAEWTGAGYVAVYGRAAPLGIPAGLPVPGGTLLSR